MNLRLSPPHRRRPGRGRAAADEPAQENAATSDGPVMIYANAKYKLGDVVRHRMFSFRGVVFDMDATFSNTEEWWEAIPEEVRPRKDQPYYHLLAENETSYYVAYVSEQNLVPDDSGEPVDHPEVNELFLGWRDGAYEVDPRQTH